jgi:hypothetical protein
MRILVGDTQHASGSDVAFAPMEEVAGQPPLARMTLLQSQVAGGELEPVRDAARRLLLAVAA